MLNECRGFVIEHKGIFEKAIIAYAAILPEPTRDNCTNPNTHILLDAMEKFLEYDTNDSKRKLYKAAWKIGISEVEHDPSYADRGGWLIEFLANSDYKPRSQGHPNRLWKEPEPYGGGYLIKDKTLLKFKGRFKILEG